VSELTLEQAIARLDAATKDTPLTYGETMGPALLAKTREEALPYWRALVRYMERVGDVDEAEAIRIQSSNLGYWTGYLDAESRVRIQTLFDVSHPMFGRSAEMSPADALAAGMRAGGGSAEDAASLLTELGFSDDEAKAASTSGPAERGAAFAESNAG
jgi:hypothetical protein